MIGKRTSTIALIAIVLGTILYARTVEMNLPGIDQGYEPSQPIAFSHRLHSGELGMRCQYCHAGVEKSRHAGIPSASTCMNCHRFVTSSWKEAKPQRESDQGMSYTGNRPVSLELKKLYDAVGYDAKRLEYDEKIPGKPIEWIRVHNLPDFVHFDHRRHVNSGVTCEHCHGPVKAMERIQQWSNLTMGWCVNCHRDVNKGLMSSLQGKSASTDCSACHY